MAQDYNFKTLKKSNTFLGVAMTVTINGVAIDTADYKVEMQLRRTASEDSPVVFEFSTEAGKDGTITRGAAGLITFEEVIIDVPAGLYYQDVKFTHLTTGKVRTWVEGTFEIGTVVTQ